MMYTRESKATSSDKLLMASDHSSKGSADMAETQHTIIRKTFKYRISPKTKVVRERLQHTLDLCRELYNAALEERKTAYQDYATRAFRVGTALTASPTRKRRAGNGKDTNSG